MDVVTSSFRNGYRLGLGFSRRSTCVFLDACFLQRLDNGNAGIVDALKVIRLPVDKGEDRAQKRIDVVIMTVKHLRQGAKKSRRVDFMRDIFNLANAHDVTEKALSQT